VDLVVEALTHFFIPDDKHVYDGRIERAVFIRQHLQHNFKTEVRLTLGAMACGFLEGAPYRRYALHRRS
jgi:hypothetical protein